MTATEFEALVQEIYDQITAEFLALIEGKDDN